MMKKSLLTGAVMSFVIGFFLIMGSRPIGVVLFVIGIGLGIFYAAMMLKTGGYSGDGAFFHGIHGQGRQQSEVGKVEPFQHGEQEATIWDKMTEDK